MDLRRTFFYELYHSNRRLLLLIMIFLGWAAFSAWTKFELTPVYNWNMFAVPAKEHSSYDVVTVEANGKALETGQSWHYFSDMVLTHTAAEYLVLKDSNYRIPEYRSVKAAGRKLGLDMNRFEEKIHPGSADIDSYPDWIRRYLAARGQNTAGIRLRQYSVCYTDSGTLQLRTTKTWY